MKIAYVTGANSALFANTCMLYDSFVLNTPPRSQTILWVCDFGFDLQHRNFFEKIGILLPTPKHLKSFDHPWYHKASIYDFLINQDYDAVVWLDADMIILEPITSRIQNLAIEMNMSGQQVSICPDDVGLNIKNYIKHVGKLDHPVKSFQQNCRRFKTNITRPYLNTGFFIVTSHALLEQWRDIVLKEKVDFLFEQNSFNVVAYTETVKINLLDPHEWNAHGQRLQTVLTPASTGPTRIIHTTSTGNEHAEGEFNLPVQNKNLAGHIKLFKRPDLQGRQQSHLMHFVENHFNELVNCGVL